MPYKPKSWPAEIIHNLDEILVGVKLLNSISTVGLKAMEKGNRLSVKMLALEHYPDAIKRIGENIEQILDHYEQERGRPVKWVKTAQEIHERHLYNLHIYQKRLIACYHNANWDCVELYLTNLPYLCDHIRQLIEAIPRESYMLRESQKIVEEATKNEW